MLCCIVLCCVVLWCVVLYVVLCCGVLCYSSMIIHVMSIVLVVARFIGCVPLFVFLSFWFNVLSCGGVCCGAFWCDVSC